MPPSRAENISSDGRHAIEVFTLAATKLIMEELSQVKLLCAQNMENMIYPSHEEQQLSLNAVLGQFFGSEPMQVLNMKKKITLNIADLIDKSRETKHFFRYDNTELVPHRLHQHLHEPALKEANPDFALEFCTALHKSVKNAIELQGENFEHIFERQWKLHAERTGFRKGFECCIFRLLEDDYHTPHFKNDENNLVVYFGFDCPTCGGRHEVRVYR